MDDPDPELGPALELLVARLASQLERPAEECELVRILDAVGEEGRMENTSALLEQLCLGAEQLPRRLLPRIGRSGEERLLVQDVRARQRIVGQVERLVPPALPAQVVHSLHDRLRRASAGGVENRVDG